MKPLKIADTAEISGVRMTDEGYMIADSFVARTGIQLYRGDEVGRPDMPIVRVMRTEDEVRSPDAMRSYSHAPVTMGHPAEMVTADNWKEHARGEVSTEAEWQDGKIKMPLILKDAEAIEAVRNGTREWSVGYMATVDFDAAGDGYDAVQRDIRVNHIALVRRGRGGSELRIGDEWGIGPVTKDEGDTKMQLRKIMVDGLEVETTEAGATAIKKLETALADTTAELATEKKGRTADIEAKDEEIGTLKATVKKLQDAAPDADALDKMVAARAALLSEVKAVLGDVDATGKSDADLRKMAVAKRLGDEAVEGASEAEIKGMFRAMKADPVRKAMGDSAGGNKQSHPFGDGYDDYLSSLNPKTPA